jgi:hypothetical protein
LSQRVCCILIALSCRSMKLANRPQYAVYIFAIKRRVHNNPNYTYTQKLYQIYTGCFEKCFTTLKANMYSVLKCHNVVKHTELPVIVMVQCDFHW